ncbi:MAG: hypothetical protein LBO78_00180 [Rickettsiales bacterium]|jgi:hypothetical protein|nr:hypothetical protein [Rickettsiales bacterium]
MKHKNINLNIARIKEAVKDSETGNLALMTSAYKGLPLRRYFFRVKLSVIGFERDGKDVTIPHVDISASCDYSEVVSELEKKYMSVPHVGYASAIIDAWQEYNSVGSFIYNVTRIDKMLTEANGGFPVRQFPNDSAGAQLKKSYENYIRKDAEMVEVKLAMFGSSFMTDNIMMPLGEIARFTTKKTASPTPPVMLMQNITGKQI